MGYDNLIYQPYPTPVSYVSTSLYNPDVIWVLLAWRGLDEVNLNPISCPLDFYQSLVSYTFSVSLVINAMLS